MATPAFEVLPFDQNAFYEALRSDFVPLSIVESNRRAHYLFGYLNQIGARVFVVEHGYTDGDYLDDYANFYVKSFPDYPRRCKRLHFFSEDFDRDKFRKLVLDASGGASTLQSGYLGFVIARPLPNAVIGRTAIATYPPDGGRRNYPTVRPYPVNLFGIPLSIDSLAFQEQDTAIAACATVALWSAFQKTAGMFWSVLPTPAQITRAATSRTFRSRPLPSRGLTLAQMASAVRDIGLEPEVIPCGPKLPLVSLLYSYLHFGLPVVLGVDIEEHGLHALTVAGYSLVNNRVLTKETVIDRVNRVGLRIDELYVHDDGFGPFAKIAVKASRKPKPDEPMSYFEGTWLLPDGSRPAKLRPIWVVIPAYHKIRLTYVDVQPWISLFDDVAKLLIADPESLEWRIHLTYTNAFKQDIKEWSLPTSSVEPRLLRQFPRFLWQASLVYNGDPLTELIFDATGIARAFPGIDVVFRNPTFTKQVEAVMKLADAQDFFGEEFTDLLNQSLA